MLEEDVISIMKAQESLKEINRFFSFFGVVANVLNCDIVENEFKLQSRYYVHFRIVNAHKTEYMCYNQTGDVTTLDGTPLKLVDKFPYLGSSVSSTEKGHGHAVNEGMDSYR